MLIFFSILSHTPLNFPNFFPIDFFLFFEFPRIISVFQLNMSSSSDEGEPDLTVAAFSQAIQQQDKQTLERLLKKRKEHAVPLPADDRNWTALHLAASDSKYEECLELILRYGDASLDLDAFEMDGKMPLFIACQNGCEKNALLLLQNGCDADQPSLWGDMTALHIAASEGHTNIVEYLLRYPVNVEAEQVGGFRPLHKAAKNGHLEICHRLLQKGASVRSTSESGQLPLHFACIWNRAEVARCLVERDFATINFQNNEGVTPFMYAAMHFDCSEIRYLLENGARLDIFDEVGKSALHYAVGNAKVFQILLERINFSSFESKWLDTYDEGPEVRSLLSSAIDNDVESVNLLLKSNLPRRILEMPDISFDMIYSPLACILVRFFMTYPDQDLMDRSVECLESSLDLLLTHRITLNNYFEQLKERYPNRLFDFYHPFSNIFSRSYAWPREKQLRYFNLLNANGVTTDYCLQCYHDNTNLFDDFVDYKRYYEPALDATASGNVEAVKLFMSNSAILEPDILLTITEIKERRQVPYCVYEYLTLLKPGSMFHEHIRLSYFDVLQVLEVYPYFNANDRFSRCTLLQLCRTAVRRQLREPTLEDNLKNFQRKISELPIPVTLKEYLLFKI